MSIMQDHYAEELFAPDNKADINAMDLTVGRQRLFDLIADRRRPAAPVQVKPKPSSKVAQLSQVIMDPMRDSFKFWQSA